MRYMEGKGRIATERLFTYQATLNEGGHSFAQGEA